MGRPKLSDLSCPVCNIKFKRKNLLDEHMKIHLSSKQSRKHLKNYCAEIDMPKQKKEIDMPKQNISPIEKCKSLVVSLRDIKIETTDKVNEVFNLTEYQTAEDETSRQKSPLKVEIPKLKCSICSMRCKGEKGLKIHMSAHKRSQHSSYNAAASNENQNNEDSNLSQSPKSSNANIPLLLSHNGAVNYTQNAQPNYVFNVSQFQNQPNNLVNVGNNPTHVLIFGNQVSNQMNSANQVNAQSLQSIPNQNIPPSDNIPKFKCDLSQSPKSNNANIPLQNVQPDYVFNVSEFQNQPNNLVNVGNNPTHVLIFGNLVSNQMNSANQVNAQSLQSIPNQNIQPSDNIPKFKCDLSQSPKSNNANIPLLLSHNGAVNYTQNAQPDYIFNVSQFQNQPNNLVNVGNNPTNVLNFGNQVSNQMNSENQVNAQSLESLLNLNIQPSDNIPKFDCDSEEYMQWLKKFVSKCKEQYYPLNAELCRKISLVTAELSEALGNPTNSLKQKANHFYFMKMYDSLSAIMLNHMQHVLGSKKEFSKTFSE